MEHHKAGDCIFAGSPSRTAGGTAHDLALWRRAPRSLLRSGTKVACRATSSDLVSGPGTPPPTVVPMLTKRGPGPTACAVECHHAALRDFVVPASRHCSAKIVNAADVNRPAVDYLRLHLERQVAALVFANFGDRTPRKLRRSAHDLPQFVAGNARHPVDNPDDLLKVGQFVQMRRARGELFLRNVFVNDGIRPDSAGMTCNRSGDGRILPVRLQKLVALFRRHAPQRSPDLGCSLYCSSVGLESFRLPRFSTISALIFSTPRAPAEAKEFRRSPLISLDAR